MLSSCFEHHTLPSAADALRMDSVLPLTSTCCSLVAVMSPWELGKMLAPTSAICHAWRMHMRPWTPTPQLSLTPATLMLCQLNHPHQAALQQQGISPRPMSLQVWFARPAHSALLTLLTSAEGVQQPVLQHPQAAQALLLSPAKVL